mmetsp:Transcript_21920/g.47611  ORF Transcript_21920/g.47611 Transcript_21920/m.47611 type:complete len:82 (-) Transcript_21920:130-375(-)
MLLFESAFSSVRSSSLDARRWLGTGRRGDWLLEGDDSGTSDEITAALLDDDDGANDSTPEEETSTATTAADDMKPFMVDEV